MKNHKLKTWPSVFEDVKQGRKTWEYRRNDRDFATGDTLHLLEWTPSDSIPGSGKFSGRKIVAEATYIRYGGQFGIPPEFCIMSLKLLRVDEG